VGEASWKVEEVVEVEVELVGNIRSSPWNKIRSCLKLAMPLATLLRSGKLGPHKQVMFRTSQTGLSTAKHSDWQMQLGWQVLVPHTLVLFRTTQIGSPTAKNFD